MSKKQTAQPVKEQEQNINENQNQETVSASSFPKEEIEKAFNNPMLKGFKKYLDPLLNYFETVEVRLQQADKNFAVVAQSLDGLKPLLQLSSQIQQRQTQQPQAQGAPTGGFDVSSILSMLPQILGSTSGGGNEMLQTLAMESLKADIDLSKTFKSAVLAKISSKAVGDIAGAVVG